MSIRVPTLPERITALRNDIDAFIDSRVLLEAAACPGVPAQSIRNMIVRGNCECAAYLQLTKEST
jgi:hypothetical protein